MMTRSLALLIALLCAPLAAMAQSSSIVGTWILTGADKVLPDGTTVPDFGSNPHGLIIFTADGHYSVQIYRADRAKFSSADRNQVTAEEFKNAALGMSVHFGTYAVDPDRHTITFRIDRASWPNWDDTVQVRSYEMKGDQLSWKVPPRPDGSIPVTTLRRATQDKSTEER
ncbi:lipocalin-like domain-containing protein [Silvibacterium dinghuense]|uniref:Lipocalin-like domain protein n=1 Tax=Silvibacterium dinghuense TaxID=1560006 RepID=A0A4Q1S9N1_9BACT|nr:lipocalin-like domain-containing protein [Silvibacterium dinghuense]RXS93763.1 lipocalin-like domain protein [Silvibacterium dinghuense]